MRNRLFCSVCGGGSGCQRSLCLPRELTLRRTRCGADDAWYNKHTGELTLCYERLAHFQQLARQRPRLRAIETQQRNRPIPHTGTH